MAKKLIIEACVESVESALIAQRAGAGRIELCSNLSIGGTTPSFGAIKLALKSISIPINVLIRPRGGDFFYNDSEFETMVHDVIQCKKMGVHGVVLGILDSKSVIDIERNKEIIKKARPLSVTFHRAYDVTPDPMEALDSLLELQVDRLLTSGQKSSAYKGIGLIKKLALAAQKKIIIMPGGGVTEKNINKIISETGVTEIHASAKVAAKVKQFKSDTINSNVMPACKTFVTSEEKLKRMLKAIS